MVGVTFQATFSTLKTITLPSRLIAVNVKSLDFKGTLYTAPRFLSPRK